jgi:hypothetical protein
MQGTEGGSCQKCHKHKATNRWIGDGGMLAYSHGFWEWWCECCVIKAQLKYAEEAAAKLKDLKAKLAKAVCEEIHEG